VKQNRLAVLHWFPIEYYPPATNLLTFFGGQGDTEVRGFTCQNTRDRATYKNESVRVSRCQFPTKGLPRCRRLWRYVSYPLLTFIQLLAWRPHVVLYIEPHSAMPAMLYTLVAWRCRLMIHCHEYHDQAEFREPGMRLVRFYHWLEKKYLYRRAEWISQTNEDRRRLFHQDHPQIETAKLMVLPNYPPRSWQQGPQATWKHVDDEPLRLVYVGSISLHDTFIEPLVRWVQQHANEISLDIFSYNNDPITHQFLLDSQSDSVRFHAGGIAYDELPDLLRDFHVGVILYRGNTRNYIYNASNKLFEYLAIGLDVWYPPQMLGVKPYATSDTTPRVIETDFQRLDRIDLDHRRNRSNLSTSTRLDCCEDALRPLQQQINNGTE
jgi:hypothetical protein